MSWIHSCSHIEVFIPQTRKLGIGSHSSRLFFWYNYRTENAPIRKYGSESSEVWINALLLNRSHNPREQSPESLPDVPVRKFLFLLWEAMHFSWIIGSPVLVYRAPLIKTTQVSKSSDYTCGNSASNLIMPKSDQFSLVPPKSMKKTEQIQVSGNL